MGTAADQFVVAGIDLSMTAGLAVGKLGEVLHTGVHTSDEKRPMHRYSEIVGSIMEQIELHKVGLCVIEDYAFAFKNSGIQNVELGTVVRFMLVQAGIPFYLIAPTSLKKFVTESGNAKKEDMKLHTFKRWGFEHKSNDVVDAYGLMKVAQYITPFHLQNCAVIPNVKVKAYLL